MFFLVFVVEDPRRNDFFTKRDDNALPLLLLEVVMVAKAVVMFALANPNNGCAFINKVGGPAFLFLCENFFCEVLRLMIFLFEIASCGTCKQYTHTHTRARARAQRFRDDKMIHMTEY